jgi:GTP cyclohydrolase IB
MLMDSNQKKNMPDIAETEKSAFLSPLEWVGMEKVALPLNLEDGTRVQAEADIFVNISRVEAKGIHMSRLYLSIQENLEAKKISPQIIKNTLNQFVESQGGLSDSALLKLRWNELHKRKALLSDYKGWKNYPVELSAQLRSGVFEISLSFSIFYSSTCPCSSALSRQLHQQAFAQEFSEDNLSFEKIYNWLGEKQISSPHSQRSRADVTVVLKDSTQDLSVLNMIDQLEACLKTPVQSAVKREDEQEFARLNGENPMFVEDALRVMQNTLSALSGISNFTVKTHHFESLHAHDAVGSIRSRR